MENASLPQKKVLAELTSTLDRARRLMGSLEEGLQQGALAAPAALGDGYLGGGIAHA